MAKAEGPDDKIVELCLISKQPRPKYNVEFISPRYLNIIHKIVQYPMAIYCLPSVQPHVAQPEGFTQFEIKFKLTDAIVKEIKASPTCALLEIRFGEELEGMSKLSEGLPGPLLITINSHETTAKNSPVYYKCSDYLYLEKVDDEKKEGKVLKNNVIKICWPLCKKPFYMVVNILESKTVEKLIEHVQFNSKMYSMTLNTKAKAMETLKNFKKTTEVVCASMKLSLLCPITNLKMKLPARSFKCSHLQSFDLRTLFSLNKINPTWKCPTCTKPIVPDELLIDSFLLDIMNSPSFPENCLQIVLYANGNWEPHIEPKKEIIEDDLSETDNEYSENMTHTVDFGNFKDENLCKPKTNDSKHVDIKPKIINQRTDNSDIVEEPSAKIIKIEADK